MFPFNIEGSKLENSQKIKVIGRLNIKGLDIIKRVYSIYGLAPTLSTMMGGQRQPKVLVRRKHE